VDDALALVRSSAREAMTEMEAMLDQLRAAPLDNAGLVAALGKQCETLGFRTGAAVTFTADALPSDDALGPGARPAVLRVAQEALANVARHARAGQVTVTLGSIDHDLKLTIADDGAGFDRGSASAGMGLRNMQSRAADVDGRLAITSAPGQGATVSLSIPALTAPLGGARERLRPWNNTIVVWAGAILVAQIWPGRPEAIAVVCAAVWTMARDHLRRLLVRKAAA
jgi:signal transduction histidine kinase